MKGFQHIIIWIAGLAVIAAALLFCEVHLLWKLQESNLFLASGLFFREQLVVPGGLLTWIGTYLTQFFYHPWQGVLLLCACWLLLMWLLKRAFKISDTWAPLMLIPVALLMITIVDMGYWVYMLKLHGHVFIGTIGASAVAALLWVFRCLPRKGWLRAVFIALTALLGYPLLGIYGLAAALLMGIWSWRLMQKRANALLCSLVAALCVITVPLLCYRHIFYQTNLDNIYFAELPLYFITEEYPNYYIPFYLLALFFLVLTLLPMRPMKSLRPVLRLTVQGAVLALSAWAVFHFWFKDENFHHELAMQHAIEQQDWETVIEEAALQKDEPTRSIVMMRNLALSRLGRQGDEMFRFKNGSKAYAAPWGMRMMLVCGPTIYFEYGMLNYCHRLCTEMGVEFGWSAQYLKLMAKCALLSDEQQLARKYIALLRQTTFYGDWADWAEQLLRHPEQRTADPVLGPVTHMLHYDNDLGSDQGNTESFLMRQLVSSTNTDDPIFQEQTLLASLYTHDASHFWYHFEDYVRLHPNARIPRYYQEAAYLYAYIADHPDLDRMPIDPSVKEGFNRFMQFAPRYEGAEVDVARKGLYDQFGQTYFYDYYMMRQLPEY